MLNLVMFSMSTCGPCKEMKKILEKIDDIEIAYVVVDKQENGRALASEWGVQAVPTLLFINEGELITTTTGLVPESTIHELIRNIQSDLFSKSSGGMSEESSALLCCPSEQENSGT